jgi:hypothetical protein
MSKPVIISLVGSAYEEWKRLNMTVSDEINRGICNSDSQILHRSISQKIELIKSCPQYGNSVPKRLIPKGLHVDNLRVVDLSGFWRMLYTLKGADVEILCFILEICDHKNYDKIFGYRKK